MKKGHVPSLVGCVIYKDTILWMNGYGDQPDLNTVYPIGSITKSFTTTAILQLMEQELITLDEDVNIYLPFSLRNPNYPNSPITFRHLLSQRASLGAITNVSLMNEYNFPGFLDQVLDKNSSHYQEIIWKPSTPGTSFAKSDTTFDLLAYLVEIITNQTFAQYLGENIFSPLNMSETKFRISEYESSRLAIGYEWMKVGEMEPRNIVTNQSDSESYGGSALKSTIQDMSRFLITEMNEGIYEGTRLLNKTTIDEKNINLMNGYGLGSIVNATEYFDSALFTEKYSSAYPELFNIFGRGVSGELHGFNQWCIRSYDDEIGIILLMNQGFHSELHYDYEFSSGTLNDIRKMPVAFLDILELMYFTTYGATPPSKQTSFPIFSLFITLSLLAVITKRKRIAQI
jgi:CubicO group peptidase (beta-lactamase class C family)